MLPIVSLKIIPVVRKFSDVFLDDLPGLSPDKEPEFSIEVIPGIIPISIPPYWMAQLELQELKKQIQELLEKGYIVFIDDILIYSRSVEEHECHLRVILQTSREK